MGGNNIVAGTVYDASGQRITRPVQVRLSTMTRGDRIAMTDNKGNFVFRNLVSGTYSVTIDKEKEYQPFTQAVEVIQLRGSPGGTYSVIARLLPRPSTNTKPAVVDSNLASVPKRAQDHYAQALELAKTRDHRGAIAELQLAIAEHPKFMLALNEMGVQYMRLNELDKADESLRAALEIAPDAFAPLMNRGIVLVAMIRYADAEPVLRAALKINADSPVPHYFLGQALANLGRFDEAEKELSVAAKAGGEQMKEAHRVLAIIYSSKGEKKKAAAELETYLKLYPKAPDADRLRTTIRELKDAADAKPVQ